MTLTTDRVLVGLAAAAGLLVVMGVVAYALLMGEGRLPLPFTIHNDTDAAVAIWIEHGGAEFQPEHDDISPRLNPGEVGVYGLDSEYASIEYANSCTDGDIIARYDDGSEIRIAPPVCTNELVEIADWVTSLYVTNDTHRTYQLWVEHDGELLVPRGGDQDVEVGATARFAIRGRYALPSPTVRYASMATWSPSTVVSPTSASRPRSATVTRSRCRNSQDPSVTSVARRGIPRARPPARGVRRM